MKIAHVESMESRRLMAGYAPDVSFANDGLLPVAGNADSNSTATTLLRSDNNGLLVTDRVNGDRGQLRLLRYTADGQVDSTFSPRVLPRHASAYDQAFLDRQNRILVISYNPIDRTARLHRYTAAGQPDTSFGAGGSVTLPATEQFTGYDPYGFDLTTAADGSIYVTAATRERQYDDIRSLYKFTANGQLFTAFGTNGILRVAEFDSNVTEFDGTTDSDGFFFQTDAQNRLLVGTSLTFGQFRFTRYLPSGKIDTTYGRRGSFDAPDRGYSSYTTYSVAFDDQGRALLLTHGLDSTLTRLTVNGRLDDAFGDNGVVALSGVGDSLIVQNDDKILLSLSTPSSDEDITFTRLLDNGSVDTAFGENGVAGYRRTNYPTDPTYNQLARPQVLAQTTDGNYLLAVGAVGGPTVEKIAPVQAARRGTSGKLYLLGENRTDRVTVTQPSANLTRVVFNGQTYEFTKRIKGVYANLAGGNNRLDSRINVPQNITTGRLSDTITTGDAPDTIFSSEGQDQITSNGGYDRISFRGGNKAIDAGGGSGVISGGGAKFYSGSGELGEVRIIGAGTDGSTEGGWNVDVRGTRVSVTLAGGSAKIKVDAEQTAFIGASVTGRVSTAIEAKRVTYLVRQAITRGTIFAGIESYIQLGDGDDVLTAGRGNDTILGAGGNDRIYGSGGDDEILGGGGDDTLVGGDGDDRLLGERGNDRLYAGTPGRPLIRTAQNFVQGGPGDDTLFGEGVNDRLV